MKRFNEGFNSTTPAPKRARVGPDDVEIRILIPSKVAGSIIGKGGANIARLRTDFVAKVTVPDCPGPERILTVIASYENALNVIQDVLPNLENTSGGNRKKQQQKNVEDADGADNNEQHKDDSADDVDLRLLVHQSQAGCVIGKGGGKVKELREKTGARIKIYSSCCPNSTDRVVQLTGAGHTALECLKEILELIKTAPIKGPDNPYDPNHFDDYYSDEYGGFGSGVSGPSYGMRGGPGGRAPPGRFGAGPPPPPRGGPMGGPPPARGGFRGGYEDLMGIGAGEEDYGMPPRGMGNGAGPGNKSTTQVTIPKDLAGAIIGKQGNRIRKVRIESGAEITIDEPLPGSSDRIITICGLPNQIQMAQYLLQQCVHQNAKGGGSRRF